MASTSNKNTDNTNNKLYEGNHNFCKISKCEVNPITNQYCMGYFCISCGVNLGDNNPRQYCQKTHCPYEYSNDENMKKKSKMSST